MPEPARAGAATTQQRETAVSVNLSENDAGKAVSRQVQESEPASNDDADQGDNNLTRQMQKRIARMQRSFDQQRAEMQAAHQRELAGIRTQLETLRIQRSGAPTDADEAAHKKVMDDLQAKLEDAQERGDSKEVARITREMSGAENRYWAERTNAMMAGAHAKANEDRRGAAEGQQQQAGAQAEPVKPQPTAAANRWMEANDLWWEDEDYAAEKGAANAIHHALVREGSDPNTDEHFAEVTRRMQRKFPSLAIKMPPGQRRRPLEDALGAEGEDGQQRRAPVRPVGGDAGGSVPRGRYDVQLDAADMATMRSIGLDPTNDKHILQFARSKRETEDAYARSRA